MTAAKPEPIEVRVLNIPTELRLCVDPKWVVWKWQKREGRWTKPPYTPKTGKLAKSDDPSTWGMYHEAVDAWKNGKGFDGIGHMLTKDDPYVGIDWDDCRDKASGECDPEMWEWIKEIDSYTEVSPSQEGFKTLIKGKLPKGGRHNEKIGLFNIGRYFCITGWTVNGTSSEIEPRQQELNNLINTYWPQDLQPAEATPQTPASAEVPPHNLTDDEIIEKALASKQGDKFKALWEGKTSGYPSPSEADLALCTMLAFWCGPDPARIDDLFRQSKLNREKWEREDYRTRTIEKAISQTTESYRPESEPNGMIEA